MDCLSSVLYSGYAGIYIATGHPMMGLTLGPVTGQLIADCVLGWGTEERHQNLRLECF